MSLLELRSRLPNLFLLKKKWIYFCESKPLSALAFCRDKHIHVVRTLICVLQTHISRLYKCVEALMVYSGTILTLSILANSINSD